MATGPVPMSARRLRLVLSPNARQDLSDILVYTEQQWGKAQRADTRTAIDRGLRELQQYPEFGRAREELRPGLRSLQVRQHVIYYRIQPSGIRVDRILHESMDAPRHLGE